MANLAHGAVARVRGAGERLAVWGRRAGERLLSRLPSGVQQRARSTIRVAFAVRAKAEGDDLGTLFLLFFAPPATPAKDQRR